jgi:hypothetical protein
MQAAVASLLDALLALHPSPQEAAWWAVVWHGMCETSITATDGLCSCSFGNVCSRLRWTIASLPKLASSLGLEDSTSTPLSSSPSATVQPTHKLQHGQQPAPLLGTSSSMLPNAAAASTMGVRGFSSDSRGRQQRHAQHVQQQGTRHKSPGAQHQRTRTPDRNGTRAADASSETVRSSQAGSTPSVKSNSQPVAGPEHPLAQYDMQALTVILEVRGCQWALDTS